MNARLHQQQDTSKFLEFDILLGLERVLDEKRNYGFKQMLLASHSVSHSVGVIRSNHSASEICFQRVKDLNVSLMLNNGEFR
jgi:hypothetical protein